MLNRNNSNNIYEDVYLDWVCKNNVKLDAKLKSKFMWRHENAEIIRFNVRYVMIVNNNKTKVVYLCLHTRYHVTCIFTHPMLKKYWSVAVNTIKKGNINWRDVQTKNVANNVDMSCLRASWQNGPYKN